MPLRGADEVELAAERRRNYAMFLTPSPGQSRDRRRWTCIRTRRVCAELVMGAVDSDIRRARAPSLCLFFLRLFFVEFWWVFRAGPPPSRFTAVRSGGHTDACIHTRAYFGRLGLTAMLEEEERAGRRRRVLAQCFVRAGLLVDRVEVGERRTEGDMTERGMDGWREWAKQKWDLEGDITRNRGGSMPPCARVPYSDAPLIAAPRVQRRGSAVSLFLGGWQLSPSGPTLLAYPVTADDLTLPIYGPPQRSSAPRKFFEFGQISGPPGTSLYW
ncbi:hypothetical protein DFH08DRAFT_944266 [Mycena albidolilacea]|uniref:Uncharacterized protein n=1 Tax=Mycena albidolilacea TaxID=1033008 RepID=A0AAD6Z658_9AGAR|nr:hypothetical protein DFH08DRAFT_944266 [Mycena albidolilacea]